MSDTTMNRLQPGFEGVVDEPASPEGQGAPEHSQHEEESRADKRIGQLRGRLTGAEQAAARERTRADEAERRAADLERRLQMADEAGQTYATQSVEAATKQAREALRRAVSEGDVEAQTEAMEALADAKARATVMAVNKRQPAPQQAQRTEQQPPQPQMSPASQAWVRRNPWVQDPDKAAAAVAVHNDLVSEGYTPDSPAYFKTLTERTRDLAGDDDDDERQPPPARPAYAGAGATRTATPNQGASKAPKIRLTAEQVEMAKDLPGGVEAYARNLDRLQREGKIGNGRPGR